MLSMVINLKLLEPFVVSYVLFDLSALGVKLPLIVGLEDTESVGVEDACHR